MIDPDNPPAELDLTRIATTAAAWIEYLETAIANETHEDSDPPTVRTVAMVVELDFPPSPGNEENGSTAVRWTCTDPRRWFQRGLFQEVADAIQHSRDSVD